MVCSFCSHPQKHLQTRSRFQPTVTFVFAAAGVADLILNTPKRHDFMGAAQVRVDAALSWQHVDGAVVASGAGAALVRETLACDVGARFAFLLQGTVVTQQAVQAESRQKESWCQQDGGQEPEWNQRVDIQAEVKPHRYTNKEACTQKKNRGKICSYVCVLVTCLIFVPCVCL